MAPRMTMLKCAREKLGCAFAPRRWAHTIAAQPPPLDSPISHAAAVSPPLVLPELDRDSVTDNNGNSIFFGFASFSLGGGSMELMAVPKKKSPINHRVSESNFLLEQ